MSQIRHNNSRITFFGSKCFHVYFYHYSQKYLSLLTLRAFHTSFERTSGRLKRTASLMDQLPQLGGVEFITARWRRVDKRVYHHEFGHLINYSITMNKTKIYIRINVSSRQ